MSTERKECYFPIKKVTIPRVQRSIGTFNVKFSIVLSLIKDKDSWNVAYPNVILSLASDSMRASWKKWQHIIFPAVEKEIIIGIL